MDYKVIFMGRLDFGTRRSFDQAIKTYNYLRETRYRQETVFAAEDLFNEEREAVILPRYIVQCNEKLWTNTINILEKVVSFALAGELHMWKISSSHEALEYILQEPRTDKSAVQAYLTGRTLAATPGKEIEALATLDQAIAIFDRHAPAYEARASVKRRLGHEEEALADYDLALHYHPDRSKTYLKRAGIYEQRGDWEAARQDLEKAMAHSIPHQPHYWEARQRLGDCLFEMEEYTAAAKEYKLFLQRNLPSNHSLFRQRRRVAFQRGQALLTLGQAREAVECFNLALDAAPQDQQVGEADILLHRALAVRQSGQPGFREDLRKAADRGSNEAAELLAEYA